MRILVTGAAGFIGFHVCKRLLSDGHSIIGIDNLNDYYDVRLKQARLAQLLPCSQFFFEKLDIADEGAMARCFSNGFDRVIHLAAQAGVRYSVQNPQVYARSNLMGFLNVLEGCRLGGVEHLVYASSSSVYGANKKQPFSVEDRVDTPISLYAATKKSNELMAHSYSHLYGIPSTGLRFFTVYGPWGRPDMAIFTFTRAILEGRPIEVYNFGQMKRDFTYIDDIVEGVTRVMHLAPKSAAGVPHRIYNIGNHQPVELLHFIALLEKYLGKSAHKVLLPLQPGDVAETYADIDSLMQDVGFAPSTPIEVGLKHFTDWYLEYTSCSKSMPASLSQAAP